jgi:hypothetical protein
VVLDLRKARARGNVHSDRDRAELQDAAGGLTSSKISIVPLAIASDALAWCSATRSRMASKAMATSKTSAESEAAFSDLFGVVTTTLGALGGILRLGQRPGDDLLARLQSSV